MSNDFYLRPRSLEEALSLLADGESEILGGGTYLIGRRARLAARLIDLERLGLDYIDEDEAGIKFGAMTRLQDLVGNRLLRHFSLGMVSEAALATRPSWMLRNMSTVGGEIVQRSRHSALVVALLALDAEVTFATASGVRRLSLSDFDPELAADAGPMIVTEVSIRARKERSRGAFRTLAQLPSQQPITAAAVRLLFDGSRVCETRAAIGSSVSVPQRLYVFEHEFSSSGRCLDAEGLRDCCCTGLWQVEFAGEHYLSVDYLRDMSALLLTRICLELLQEQDSPN
jgi:CO/xanthine dehydrogenase FAD-binding subunit